MKLKVSAITAVICCAALVVNIPFEIADTDNDGISNDKEHIIGTDPFNGDQNNNNIKDGEEEWTLSFTVDEDDVYNYDSRVIPTLTVTDKPDMLWTVEFQKYDLFLNEETTPGFLGNCYIPHAGEFNKGRLSFKFKADYLLKDGFDPVIYKYDRNSGKLTEVPQQTVDLQNCTVSADIYELTEYILLDRTEVEKVWSDRIER